MEDCTLLCDSWEPCPMCRCHCTGKDPQSGHRIYEQQGGNAPVLSSMIKEPGLNHQAQVVTGILEECLEMMSSFLLELRKKKALKLRQPGPS